MARNQRQTTTQFQADLTVTVDDVGLVLRWREDDSACVFLGPEGCTVHIDRPLACRLYPLGREVSETGTESWKHAPPHPETEGEYGVDGTIGDFIAGQDTALYMQATDEYAGWVRRAFTLLAAKLVGQGDVPIDLFSVLLDMDAAIAAHCKQTAEQEPEEIEARKRLHLQILDRQLEQFRGDGND